MIAHANEWGTSDSPLSVIVQGNSLILKTPDGSQKLVLHRGDQQDYNNRVALLQKDVIEASDPGE